MTRQHGRGGRIYMALTSGGTAEPLAFMAEWEINFTAPRIDVTAFTDPNKVTVQGLPAADGSFRGFADDATVQTYTAATDGVARRFYLYPFSVTSIYWFGTINVDASFGGSVSGAVTTSANWEAATPIVKVG